MPEISTVKLAGINYSIKDANARQRLAQLESTLSSAMQLKGVINNVAEFQKLANYKIGWCYKASASFTIPDLGIVENGDMIICISDYSTTFKPSDWTVVQNNVDVMVGADGINAGSKGLVPAPKASDNNKYLRGDGTYAGFTTDALTMGAETLILNCGTSSDILQIDVFFLNCGNSIVAM